jgi:hypothetical protein
VTGIPLPIAQHLLLALAIYLLVRATRPLLPGPGWAFALFAILWLNPMSYEMAVLGRVLRQHIYTPCALMVLAGAIALCTRAGAPAWKRLAWATVLGAGGGWMWITREETLWIVPCTLMLIGIAAVAAACRTRAAMPTLRSLWPLAPATLLALAPATVISDINHRHYGWRGTCEFRAAEFLAAYGALSRVLPPDGPRPYIPISKATRALIYEVSPAFAELRPHLEGPSGLGAAGPSEPYTGQPASDLEIAGGWFMWALRDAVQQTPHARDARSALDFYARLAAEVNAACEDGRLPAGPPRATMRPIWHSFYTDRIWTEAPHHLGYFARFAGFTAHTPKSIGNVEGLTLTRDLTQWRHSRSDDAPHLDMVYTQRFAEHRITLLQRLGKALRWVNFSLLLVGLAAGTATVVLSLIQRKMPPILGWISAAAWGGTLTIMVITFIINTTSFWQHNPGYFSHAYPFALFAALTSLASLALVLRNRKTLPGAQPAGAAATA